MGEVTAFRNKRRARAKPAPAEGSAQILFFLGVRYQREEEETASAEGADAASGRRRSGGTRARPKKRA
jgi:hypothetical protein